MLTGQVGLMNSRPKLILLTLAGGGQGCIRRGGTSEAAPEAVRQAVGGGCQSGRGQLLSVTDMVCDKGRADTVANLLTASQLPSRQASLKPSGCNFPQDDRDVVEGAYHISPRPHHRGRSGSGGGAPAPPLGCPPDGKSSKESRANTSQNRRSCRSDEDPFVGMLN